ncbi:MAG: HAD hydrolase-like protein [Candidatus Omnitrophota bacterium]
MFDKQDYKTWIFDCDGVILDSNPIKTKAFYEVGLPYGKEYAMQLEAYHQEFGGISRFDKFRYFFKDILKKQEYSEELSRALNRYAELVSDKLLQCKETDGARTLFDNIPSYTRKIVVSGSLETELRQVFAQRKLERHFDAIYGSPQTKMAILQREKDQGRLGFPSVFIGDSRYDYECAQAFKIDFIFVARYTEFNAWKDYFDGKEVRVVSTLVEI